MGGKLLNPENSIHLDTVDRAKNTFRKNFGSEAGFIAAAPGRVNLIGDHTDYNDGLALPLSIDRYTVIAGNRGKHGLAARIFSGLNGELAELHAGDLRSNMVTGWQSYVRGVVAGFTECHFQSVPGFEAVVESSLPVGAGLSSSAALAVALATFLEAILGSEITPVEKAQLCQKAEYDFAGVPCGIMDPFAAVFGQSDQLLLLDCQSLELEYIPFESNDVTILVVDSRARRELADGRYALRRRQSAMALSTIGCRSYREVSDEILYSNKSQLNDIEFRRARHVVSECQRVRRFSNAIQSDDFLRAGELLFESHESLRIDYDVSCVELDFLVDSARQIGPEGGMMGMRMTGGGFGGCTVSLVRKDCVNEIAENIKTDFEYKFGMVPQMFTTRPSLGAHMINPSP